MKRVLKLLLIGVMVIFPNVVHAETLDVNSKEIKTLNEKYKFVGKIGAFSLTSLYYEKNYTIDKMSDEEMVHFLSSSSVIENIKEESFDKDKNYDYTLAPSDYNNGFKKFFGPDVTVKNVIGEEASMCRNFWYDKENDIYKMSTRCGGTGPGANSYITSASKNDKNIIVNVKAYGYVYDEEIAKGKKYILPLDIFANEKANTNMPVNSYDSKEVDQKYGEYLDTYKFTFKKASNGEYYFYSVENMKDAKEYKVSVSKGNNKVSNPKTADQNIVIISVVGIVCLGILFTCSRKLLKHQ